MCFSEVRNLMVPSWGNEASVGPITSIEVYPII